MLRYGKVLVFKEGVSEEEAEEALKKIEDVIDDSPDVIEFDDSWGCPVWYIP